LKILFTVSEIEKKVEYIMEPVKLGVVGLGAIATHTHLPILLKMKDKLRIVALCDTDEERLGKASAQFGINRVYKDYDEMLKKEMLDCIDICTPPSTHKPLCLKAFNMNVNCIVEKPLTTNLAEADELIEVAKSKNLGLFVIHNSSFVPVLRKARHLFNSGQIGDLIQVDVKFAMPPWEDIKNPNHWAHKLPGGVLGELAPHPAMILSEFINGEIIEVKAEALKRGPYPFMEYDELKVLVKTSTTLGAMSISFNSPMRKMTIDLMGSKLWVYVDADSQALVKYPPITNVKEPFYSLYRGTRSLYDIFQRCGSLFETSVKVIGGKWKPATEGHIYLFNEVVKALRKGALYPVDNNNVKKEILILEATFDQIKHVKTNNDTVLRI